MTHDPIWEPGDLYRREYLAACAWLEAPTEDAAVQAGLELVRIIHEEAARRRCRLCGCTETTPCQEITVDGVGIACAWVDSDLCSFCASTMQRDKRILTTRGAAAIVAIPC